jgi:hypothetical protein
MVAKSGWRTSRCRIQPLEACIRCLLPVNPPFFLIFLSETYGPKDRGRIASWQMLKPTARKCSRETLVCRINQQIRIYRRSPSLAPHTEADPAAILLQFLAAFGNLVGPAPHCLVSAPPVTASISSSSWSANRARPAKEQAGARSPASSPKSTPLGRAPRHHRPPHSQRHHPRSARSTTPTDRRLFLLSEEFASVLHVLGQRDRPALPSAPLRLGRRRSLRPRRPPLPPGHRPISASWVMSPKASSPTTSAAPNRTTALPTAVSGPACAAANPCPRAAASRRRSRPPLARELRRALDWVHSQPKSSSAAPQPLESCGMIAILP